MAPTLLKRYCYSYDYNGNCYSSGWSNWGRWVLLGGLILLFLFFALLCSCFNARRRRRRGLAPYYGTGWAAGKYGNAGPMNNGYAQPAPPYSPPVQNQATGNTFHSNDGYYGQQSGVELQQPPNAYNPPRGGENVYSAPSGPPPNRKMGY